MKRICTSCGQKKAEEDEEICKDCQELSLDTDTAESSEDDDDVELLGDSEEE